MAAAHSSNDLQAIADRLQAIANRTPSEEIFHEALEDARTQASNENDPQILKELAKVQDKSSMEETIRKALADSPSLGQKHAKRWDRRALNFSQKFNKSFEIAQRISECSACPANLAHL
jgi:hypothetical protein